MATKRGLVGDMQIYVHSSFHIYKYIYILGESRCLYREVLYTDKFSAQKTSIQIVFSLYSQSLAIHQSGIFYCCESTNPYIKLWICVSVGIF